MPNGIKYSTTAQSLALKVGNFWIGTGDVDKSPTETTGYWNGITPPTGGYTVYLNKESQGPSIYTCNDDSDLVTITNMISGESFTTATQSINWYRTQTDKMVLNRDYPFTITNGLTWLIDFGFRPSYSSSGATVYDLTSGNRNGSFSNSPTFVTTDGGAMQCNGANQNVNGPGFSSVTSPAGGTLDFWYKKNNTSGSFYLDFILWGRIWYELDEGYNFRFVINTSGGLRGWGTGINRTDQGIKNVVLTWSRPASTLTVSVYVNGVLTSQNSENISFLSYPDTLQMGVNFASNVYVSKIYNRALTASEVLQNYNGLKGRFGL